MYWFRSTSNVYVQQKASFHPVCSEVHPEMYIIMTQNVFSQLYSEENVLFDGVSSLWNNALTVSYLRCIAGYRAGEMVRLVQHKVYFYMHFKLEARSDFLQIRLKYLRANNFFFFFPNRILLFCDHWPVTGDDLLLDSKSWYKMWNKPDIKVTLGIVVRNTADILLHSALFLFKFKSGSDYGINR